VLSEKGIPFEVTEIDLKDKPDWFLEISPYGKVPVVKHGDQLIYESAIINEYLDEVFSDTPMLSGTPAERAGMRIWIDFCNSRIQPGFVQIARAEADQFAEKVAAVEASFDMLEEYLESAGRPDPYFAGDRLTLVDASYAPAFERFGVLKDLRGYEIPARFKRIHQWATALAKHPSVKAHAISQESLLANYSGWVPESARSQVA
jgi:glutathione S-transferase